jgi:uncharacterized LabA/DUF88 family protein
MKKRIIIFIDGGNLYHILKSIFPDKKPNDFNFEKFIEDISKFGEYIETYYYNVPLDIMQNKEKYIKQQRFFDKIKRITNFNFILCRMLKRNIDGKIIYEAKEEDIYLAVDMVSLAYEDKYDVAILISSDGDFVPAIKAVQKIGKEIANIGFERKFSYHLKQVSNIFKILKKEEIAGFFD